MKNYFDFKKEHPDKIILFRINDYYQAFNGDAQLVSKALNLSIMNQRVVDQFGLAPLTGFHEKELEGNLSLLNRAGYTVALCDFDENLSQHSVDRTIVRISVPDES